MLNLAYVEESRLPTGPTVQMLGPWQEAWREPTQAQEDHANSTQNVPRAEGMRTESATFSQWSDPPPNPHPIPELEKHGKEAATVHISADAGGNGSALSHGQRDVPLPANLEHDAAPVDRSYPLTL